MRRMHASGLVVVLAIETMAFGWFGAPSLRAQASAPPAPDSSNVTFSELDLNTTPEKNISFHGPFARITLQATSPELPAHDFIEVSMDLLIMCSWDGSIPVPDGSPPTAIGPDYVRIGVVGGPTLVYSTFSTIPVNDGGFRDTSKAQSYPMQLPGVRVPPHSGAKEHNTLGYFYPEPGPPQPIPMDSTYAIKYVIPHHGTEAVVEITGLNLQGVNDESWGVANMRVRAMPAAEITKPTADEIAAAFKNSLDQNATELHAAAFQTLISGMDDTVGWFEKNVQPVGIDVDHVQKLITQMRTAGLEQQEVAINELRGMGHAIEPYLRDARAIGTAKTRPSIDRLLETFGVTPVPDENLARVIVATRALEIIGTPRAMAFRAKLTAK